MKSTQQLQHYLPNHERVAEQLSRVSEYLQHLYPSALEFFEALNTNNERKSGATIEAYPVRLASTPGVYDFRHDNQSNSTRYLAYIADDSRFPVISTHYGTMGLVTNILTFVFTVSFLTFVAFFGRLPIFRRTPIGFAHRLIWVYVPKILGKIDGTLTGGRLGWYVIGGWNRLLYGKHPVVLIFFLGLVSGGASLFVPSTWPYMTNFQAVAVLALVPQPFIWTYLCNQSTPNSPHIITHETHAEHMTQYPYDYKLFHPNVICKTCQFIKPARSKHCSLCKACVARSDHHCIWVNNCLGRGNYKYFIGLLAGTSLLLVCGAWVAYSTLSPQVKEHWKTYPEWHSPAPGTQEFVTATRGNGFFDSMMARGEYYLDVFATALMVGGVGRGGVGLLCLLTWPLPATLLAYHIYLIWLGATTNESGKWSDWKEDIADNLAFVAPILENENVSEETHKSMNGAGVGGVGRSLHHQHTMSAPVPPSPSLQPNIQAGHQSSPQYDDEPLDPWPSYQPPQQHDINERDSPNAPNQTVNDSSWRWSAWPKRATQFMVLTNDGHTPRLLQPHITKVVGKEPAWQRVRSLKEIENTYDLGFWANMRDLMFN